MNQHSPSSRLMAFEGPEGRYQLRFEPGSGGPKVIRADIADLAMDWHVETVDLEASPGPILCGMTSGSQALWNDQFWFELRLGDDPPRIRYWGNRIVWREDFAA